MKRIMYEIYMNMKKIILFGMLGLLLAACNTSDDETYENSMKGVMDAIGKELRFEGVWSINDVPVEGTYTTVCHPDMEGMYVFKTFPYQALVNDMLKDAQITDIDEENSNLAVQVSMVGNSATNCYYNANQAMYQYMSFDVITQDEGRATVKLGLDSANSVFSFSDKSASCILVVERVEMDYENGQHKTLALSGVRKLTFVSTKKL